MKFFVMTGSPRPAGHTAELLKPFLEELEACGAQVRAAHLAQAGIAPCLGCYACQSAPGAYGCVIEDGMHGLAQEMLEADCLVLATPIYTWYCTAEMKAVLDRMFGLNKFSTGERMLEGRLLALVTTHGDDAESAAGPLETGISHLCTAAGMRYLGMYSVQDREGMASFQSPGAVKGARAFARELLHAGEVWLPSPGGAASR